MHKNPPSIPLDIQLAKSEAATAAELADFIARALRDGKMPPDAAELEARGFTPREVRKHRSQAVAAARRTVQAERTSEQARKRTNADRAREAGQAARRRREAGQ